MRRVLGVLVIIGLVSVAAPACAQRDTLGMGETLAGKVIRADKSEYDVQLHADPDHAVKSVFSSGLTYQKLPQHIRAALGFLVRWGRGQMTVPPPLGLLGADVAARANPDPLTPVVIDNRTWFRLKEVDLKLPVSGLSTVRTSDGALSGVRVHTMTVTTPDGTVTGSGVLEMRTETDGWLTITHVTVTPR